VTTSTARRQTAMTGGCYWRRAACLILIAPARHLKPAIPSQVFFPQLKEVTVARTTVAWKVVVMMNTTLLKDWGAQGSDEPLQTEALYQVH